MPSLDNIALIHFCIAKWGFQASQASQAYELLFCIIKLDFHRYFFPEVIVFFFFEKTMNGRGRAANLECALGAVLHASDKLLNA